MKQRDIPTMRRRWKRVTCALSGLAAGTGHLPAGEPPVEPQASWKQEVEAGLNGSSGNSDAMNLHLGYGANYKDPEVGWKLTSAHDRAKNNGVESRNQFFADLQRDWFWRDNPWFAFLQGRYDWDKFKDWDYRLAASGGAGYEFIRTPEWHLAGRFGLGGSKSYGGNDKAFASEALLALELAWNISEREFLDFNTTVYPNLDQGGEYRNISAFNWRIKMSERVNLAMKIGLVNEYDSLAPKGSDKNDFKYNLSLVWGL